MSLKDIPEDAPAPRLCHLVKWPSFDGFGFNLHGEKNKPGQYIGKVDPDSPAESAGLKPNDRIIEVNGCSISNENHKQVVTRIKAVENETKLLVLDEKADQYYKNLGIVVNGSLTNVIYAKTPVPPSSTTLNNATVLINGSDKESNSTGAHSDEDRASHSDSGSSIPSKNNSLTKKDSRNGFSMDDDSSGPSPTPPGSSTSPSPTPILSVNMSNGKTVSLDLNMTASEMRAKLAAKKKEKLDAKNQKIDLRKKYDIIQTL